MLIEIKRNKLINVIIFFIKNTKYCFKLKLFKLLYYLDFESFKLTGRSVTGLKYYAWRLGPVPKDLNEELESPREDFIKSISIKKSKEDFEKTSFIPHKEFNEKIFTKREISLLKKYAEIFKETLAKDMTACTHEINSPWDRVYNQENNKNKEISYFYKLEELGSVDKEYAKELEKDDEEIKLNFG